MQTCFCSWCAKLSITCQSPRLTWTQSTGESRGQTNSSESSTKASQYWLMAANGMNEDENNIIISEKRCICYWFTCTVSCIIFQKVLVAAYRLPWNYEIKYVWCGSNFMDFCGYLLPIIYNCYCSLLGKYIFYNFVNCV